jgi:hypothetical protein
MGHRCGTARDTRNFSSVFKPINRSAKGDNFVFEIYTKRKETSKKVVIVNV